MSKRPLPSSPQLNPRPPKTRLTSHPQNETQPGNPRAPAQESTNVLHDKTNAPKTTVGKPSKAGNETVEPKKATGATTAKPKTGIAPKPMTNSKHLVQPKPTTSKVATKSSTTSRLATKGRVAIEILESSSDGSGNHDSDYEDIEDDQDDENLVAEPEVDEPGEDEPEEDERVVKPKAKGKTRGRKPKVNKPQDQPDSDKSEEDEPVVEAKAKGKTRGRKPKVDKARGKSSTNRVQRKSFALTTPAARDMFNGMDKYLNKWAKCSELHILRTREERKSHEIHMACLAKEEAHHQAMVKYEETWLKRNPARVNDYHKIHAQDSERKLLETKQKSEKMSMERLELEVELLRLRDDHEKLKREKEKEQEEVEEAEQRRDLENMQSLYDNM
ncbi:hypothetical protein RSAG8_03789, partial [Rhizoctonia solani AG-8 WAC10335]